MIYGDCMSVLSVPSIRMHYKQLTLSPLGEPGLYIVCCKHPVSFINNVSETFHLEGRLGDQDDSEIGIYSDWPYHLELLYVNGKIY